MSEITTTGTLFTPNQVGEIFSKVKGHSTIAKLSGQTPIPFAGTDLFVFTMDGEAALVGEGEDKPAGTAGLAKVTVKPLKVVYQHRVTDEFMKMSEEKAVPFLEQCMDGFAKKIAKALDIMAFHGVNPATNTESDLITSSFDKSVTQTINYDAANADDNLQQAVKLIAEKDGDTNGIAMSRPFSFALGEIKKKTGSKESLYEAFRFSNPGSFSGIPCDANSTVNYKGNKDMAIVGDFQNALKWGYADNVETEIIEYGDPDGKGDLKRMNQVCLRVEAYVGWGVIDPESFVRIVEAAA